jgi:hypothetical protein
LLSSAITSHHATARAFGLSVPQPLLVTADEVIEIRDVGHRTDSGSRIRGDLDLKCQSEQSTVLGLIWFVPRGDSFKLKEYFQRRFHEKIWFILPALFACVASSDGANASNFLPHGSWTEAICAGSSPCTRLVPAANKNTF